MEMEIRDKNVWILFCKQFYLSQKQSLREIYFGYACILTFIFLSTLATNTNYDAAYNNDQQ